MKKITAVFLAMVLIMFFVVSVNASEKKSSGARQITGSVSDVNAANNTVTVKKKDTVIILTTDDKTKVAQCNEGVSINDIKVGDKITASYKEAGESNAAQSITVTNK
ncbi:MAG: hypothetical protein Q7U10_00450 [Thermodesulfovibrionia bacterium]|nr:hypothetical protein [Thermodesulfovibrionia bacterium]